jgi:hypothetical protein
MPSIQPLADNVCGLTGKATVRERCYDFGSIPLLWGDYACPFGHHIHSVFGDSTSVLSPWRMCAGH